MAGLTPTGFDIKTVDQIIDDIQTVELALISPSLDLQPTALIGVINGIFGAALAEVWLLAGALYNGVNPDEASDDQLTSLALIVGTVRQAATQTQVIGVVVNVDAGFSALAGTMFATVVGNTVNLFTNKTDVTNPGFVPANVIVDFEAVDTGPIQALAGTLTVIAQPLAGWNTVTNPTDGVIGSPIESDADLRIRRELELEAVGSTTADAIRSDVLRLMQPPTTTSATTGVTVLFNDTDVVDANGLLPHSIEVISDQPGATAADDEALAQLILEDKAAGINTNGTSFEIVQDSRGNSETIRFTRPGTITIYIDMTVLVNPALFPIDGVVQIKASLVAFANEVWQPGADVFALHTKAQAFGGQVISGTIELTPPIPGVLDVTVFKIDTIAIPVNTGNIVIAIRDKAVLSTGNIAVTVI
jgi:hypothetical protein